MKKSFLILATLFLTMAITFTSCSKEDMGLEETEVNGESGGEGNEGGEGSEGGEGGSEQGESGTRWSINNSADEIIKGVRTIIRFNTATNAFEGTLENLNTNVAQQTRLEVHIIEANGNTTEFGPTPGVDMQPGTTRNISLPLPAGATFVEFTMHTEVGSGGEGGEGGDGEGGEGGGGEGGDGGEQGESGARWSIDNTADEIINGVRTIIRFNTATNTFEGTLENLNTNVAQQTRLEVHIIEADGNTTEFGPTPGVDMQPGATRSISLPITAGATFVEFTMHTEVGSAGSGG